jgi:valyl-tRNA synthetase
VLHEFTWHELCDWYLELAKPVLQGGDADARRTTQHTLVSVFEALLRLLHPLLPFITEELWQKVAARAGIAPSSVMVQPLPQRDDFHRDEAAETGMDWLQAFILGIRRIRGEMDIAPGRPLPAILEDAGESDRSRVAEHGGALIQLARLERIELLLPGSAPPPGSAVVVLGQMKIHVPLAGLIDIGAEVARLQRQRGKVAADLARGEAKLTNPNFRDNAPAEIVAKEQARSEEARTLLRELDQQIARLSEIG